MIPLHMSSSDLVETRSGARKRRGMQKYDLDVSDELLKYGKILDDDGADLDYKEFLLRLIAEKLGAEANGNLTESNQDYGYNFSNDDEENEEEEDDPDFVFLLQHLEPYEKSCILRYKDKDLSHVIKFGEATSSESEHDEEERRRKPRTATEQKAGPSCEMSLLQNKGIQVSERDDYRKFSSKKKVPRSTSVHSLEGDSSLEEDTDQERRRMLSRTKRKNESKSARTKVKEKPATRVLQNKAKSKKENGIIQIDPDYLIFHRNVKFYGDHYAYESPGHEIIVYEKRHGEINQVKEEPYDGSYSDVEIMDSTEFYNMNTSRRSSYWDTTEFRRKVIADLKRPFDKEEYERLWRDIKLHKTKERHLELRCGGERPFGTQEMGKSYLDHYPGEEASVSSIFRICFETKLFEAKGDRPKCLNLLRGFFSWIKQPEGFFPWADEECLSTYPDSS